MESSTPERRYDRAEMAEILRRASEDVSSLPEPEPGDDRLSLREIERIAKEVGIEPSRVRSAALALASQSPEHAPGQRMHLSATVPGTLSANVLQSVADHLRSTIGPGQVRTADGSLSFDAEKDDKGRLTIEVRRASDDDVAVQLWAQRATSRRGAIASGAIYGAIFGSLAAAAMQPVLLDFLGVTAAVTAGGAGLALGLWNRTGRRWQQRIAVAHDALARRVAELVSHPRDAQALQPPSGDDG